MNAWTDKHKSTCFFIAKVELTDHASCQCIQAMWESRH